MNYFLDALRKYADFNGRSRRSEYWYFMLFYFIIFIALSLVEATLGMTVEQGGFQFLTLGLSIALLIPRISVAVRRMHDVGKSGWFILVPIYNLILACTNGDDGSNEYGPDPKNPYVDDLVDHLVE